MHQYRLLDVCVNRALMEVTLSVGPGSGTLTMTSTSGLTFTDGANGTASMTFRGTVNAVNSALSRVNFMPAMYYNGTTTLTFTSQALDNSGNSIPELTVTSTVNITVLPKNHAPTVQVPGAQTTNQNMPLMFSSPNNPIVLGDPDVNPAVNVVQLTLTATRGTVRLSTTAGLTTVSGDGTAKVVVTGTINALNAAVNGLIFTPTLNTYGTAYLVVTLNDMGNPVGSALQPGKTITINVVQVNQKPVVSGPTSVTRTSGSVVFSNAYLISVSDVDAGSSIEEVTLTVTSGTLTLGSTTGLTYVSGNGTSSITIRGTLTYLNNALKGLRYTGSATTLLVTINDGSLGDTLIITIL